MDILEKLYQNEGLLHVALQIVKFMDNLTIAQCRLVNTETNEFLANTWRNRAVQKASEFCKEKFLIGKAKRRRRNQGIEDIDIESCIFDSWPDWKIALHEIKDLRLKDILPVTILLKNFCRDYSRKRYGVSHCYAGGKPPSPLHFAVSESRFLREENNQRALEILGETSLDFSVCDEKGKTIVHYACRRSPDEALVWLETFEKPSIDPNVLARLANVRDREMNYRPIDYVRNHGHRNSDPTLRLIEKLEKYTSD